MVYPMSSQEARLYRFLVLEDRRFRYRYEGESVWLFSLSTSDGYIFDVSALNGLRSKGLVYVGRYVELTPAGKKLSRGGDDV